MPDLAILTLTRNAPYLVRLSDALGEQLGAPDCERYVVNNALTQDIEIIARGSGWAGITPSYNLSFSEGNNLAASQTTAPYLLLLNDDAIPHKTFLAELWNARERADVVGSLLLHKDGTVNHAGTAVWASTCRTDHIGRGAPRAGFEGFAVTPAATFAAVLVRREVWDRLGGLDERYVYGWEDTDFCLRACSYGFRVGVARDAVAVHDECGTRPRGGTRDTTNFTTFRETWSLQLPDVLQRYAEANPGVEGAYA